MSNYQEFLLDATLNKPVCMCFQSANVVAIHFQGKNFLSPPLDALASHPGGQHTKKAVHTPISVSDTTTSEESTNPEGNQWKQPRGVTGKPQRKSQQMWRLYKEPTEIPSLSSKKESGRIVQTFISISDMSSAVFVFALRVRIHRYVVQFLLIPWRAVVTRYQRSYYIYWQQ